MTRRGKRGPIGKAGKRTGEEIRLGKVIATEARLITSGKKESSSRR